MVVSEINWDQCVVLPVKLPPDDHLKEVRLEIMSLYVFSIPPALALVH